MRYWIPLISIAMLVGSSRAQETADREQGVDNAARAARIRELVSQSSGAITAIEPSSLADGSAIIGFSSGAVMRCDATGTCASLIGTPNVAVENIAVSRRGDAEVLWISYRQGALYQCQAMTCENPIR